MAPRMKDCVEGCARGHVHPAPYACWTHDAEIHKDEMQSDMGDALRSALRRQYAEMASREFFRSPNLNGAQKIDEHTTMGRPALIDVFHPALVRANDILRKKSEDYGTVGDYAKKRYFPFGHKSYVQMIHTKVQRLIALVTQEGGPNFESLDDTLLDLINYAAFYSEWLQGGVPEEHACVLPQTEPTE